MKSFFSSIFLLLLLTSGSLELLNKIIAQHFYRHGMDEVADKLIKESGIPVEEILSEPYADLHRIFEEINNRNLQSALEWATQHSNELDSKNSSLEFKLHRLAFLQILEKGIQAQGEAISYARTYFSKFVDRFEKDIQILMGTLIYLQSGIQNSPYKCKHKNIKVKNWILNIDLNFFFVVDLWAPEMWIEAADVFLKDACNILGINKDSALSVITFLKLSIFFLGFRYFLQLSLTFLFLLCR